jgi:hypothetical protein
MADIVRVFASIGTRGVNLAVDRSRAWGCHRSLIVALLLQERLVGHVAVSLNHEERKVAKPLAAFAMRAILNSNNETTSHGLLDLADDLRATIYAARLSSDWRALMFPVLRFLVHPDDVRILKLGAKWSVLYALVGRALAARRLARRTLARPNPTRDRHVQDAKEP